MVNCALVLIMKLKWFFGITHKWPIECWILAFSLLLLILHTCSTPLEITSFLFWCLTIPPSSGIPSSCSSECRGSMEIFWKWYLYNKNRLQEHLLDRLLDTCTWECKIIKIIHGVPKVCSSNFMHYNFWSKLYFYMKFLENVYFSITYSHVLRISVTGMLFLLLLFFLSHTAAIAAWCRIQLVDPQMIIFNFFYHLVHRSQFNPQTIFVYYSLGTWKKTSWGHSFKKDNHSCPLPQQGFCTSSQT